MNLCIQIEGYVSPFADQLPKVQTEDLIYIEKFEDDAYGHWLFGVDGTSLIDKVNSRALTLQAGATVQPMYSENYVRLGAKNGNALESQLLDSAGISFTISAVVYPEGASALSILFGTLQPSVDNKGAAIFSSAGKVFATARPSVSSLDAGIALDLTKPLFASLSVNKVTNAVNILLLQNGVFYEKVGSTAYISSGTAIALSNSLYTSSHSILNTKYYEAIIHDKSLSLTEMKAVAMRAKIRLENRGIVF